jgi:hypothetical protein
VDSHCSDTAYDGSYELEIGAYHDLLGSAVLHIECRIAPGWTPVYQKGSYGSMDVGSASFSTTFEASPNKIVKRSYVSYAATHREVYCKRITPTASYSVYALLIDSWVGGVGTGVYNTLDTDFGLYSTYEDAIAGHNKWTFCNYYSLLLEKQIAFPRDCGPTGYVPGQWATRTYGQANIEWRIEGVNALW